MISFRFDVYIVFFQGWTWLVKYTFRNFVFTCLHKVSTFRDVVLTSGTELIVYCVLHVCNDNNHCQWNTIYCVPKYICNCLSQYLYLYFYIYHLHVIWNIIKHVSIHLVTYRGTFDSRLFVFSHKSATSLNSLESSRRIPLLPTVATRQETFSDKSYSYRVWIIKASSLSLPYLENHACPAIVRVIVTDLLIPHLCRHFEKCVR